jgi:hypothetical protein
MCEILQLAHALQVIILIIGLYLKVLSSEFEEESILCLNNPDKLEAGPFFFLNFKGTPSQELHKTISAA